jgi:hypothetical protein
MQSGIYFRLMQEIRNAADIVIPAGTFFAGMFVMHPRASQDCAVN